MDILEFFRADLHLPVVHAETTFPVSVVIPCLLLLTGLLFAAPAWADYERGLFLYKYTYQYHEARAEFLAAARDTDHPGAAFYLGEIYEGGVAVDRDPAQALHWYRRAARQGHVAAQRTLADLYRRGLGTEVDMQQAFDWYRRAAEAGDYFAQYWLGLQYRDGLGTRVNAFAAYKWLSIAASYGHQEALVERAAVLPMLTPGQRTAAARAARDWERDREARRRRPDDTP